MLRNVGQGGNNSTNDNNGNSNNNSNLNNTNSNTISPATQPLIKDHTTLTSSLQMLITKDENSDLAIWWLSFWMIPIS